MSDAPVKQFWSEVFALHGAVEARIAPQVLVFGAFALILWLVHAYHLDQDVSLHVDVGPHEVAGAMLGLVLVLRTNAGHDRWWEARRLWGGMVNQCRDLAVLALGAGPADPAWRSRVVRWTAAFAHVSRRSLRGQRELPEVAALVGDEGAARVAAAEHMPGYVALVLDRLLREGVERVGLDRFVLIQAERERCLLIDHLGGCERILKTPLVRVYSITIRRFITLYLVTLPFALLEKVGWLTPVITALVAYVMLALDRIGVELQNPFDPENLSHLPLDSITETIQKNLLALIDESPPTSDAGGP
jgi:putative membrane protein